MRRIDCRVRLPNPGGRWSVFFKKLGVKATLIAILLAILMAAGACATQVATPEPVYMQIAGSSSLASALEALAEAYTERHPEVTIDIQAGGTRAGLQSLEEGRIDLAASSWKGDARDGIEVTPTETQSPDLVWFPIARDGLAIITHPDNTLENLSLDEARELFAGWQVDWSEVGGKGGEIEVISREDGSGTRMAFESLVMGERSVTQTAIVMPSSQAVIDWVNAHNSAVGYVSMALITDTVQAVRIDDIELSARSVERGEYPLTREVYLVARKPISRPAQDFVDFCLSPAGQAIVSAHHARAE
jgi:phosphate transport system substrate-binding protein